MNAIKFIQENGVEKAREVLRGSPALECYFIPKYQQYFVDKYGFVYVLGMFGYFTPSLSMTIEMLKEHGFKISDLKRLVESVTTIEKFGGIDEARRIANSSLYFTADRERMHKSIADYEQIFGGEHV